MAQDYPFRPIGNLSVAQLPTVATQTTTLPGGGTTQGPTGSVIGTQLRIVNRNTQDVWVAFGQGTAVTCTVPTVGANANGLIVLSGEDAIFTPPIGTDRVATAQLTAGTGNVYFTIGEGL